MAALSAAVVMLIRALGLINRIILVAVPWATILTLSKAKVKGFQQQSLDVRRFTSLTHFNLSLNYSRIITATIGTVS
jgi:hypothetical protein